MALYMKYADIEGSATSSAHDKWIPLSSCQWGGGRGITTHVGAAKNREASHAQISEMVVTKTKDNASRPLYQRSLTKPVGESVTVHIATTSQGNANVICEIIMSNVLISGFSNSTGGEAPTESISLNFTKIESKFVGQAGAASTASDPYTVIFDLATAETS